MPLLQSSPPTQCRPLPFFQPLTSSPRSFTVFSRNRFKFRRRSMTITLCSAPEARPLTELDILTSIAELDGDEETTKVPCIRTYENELGRLTLIGDVSFEQALTAAAADGGEAAEEHIVSGIPTMVVETLFPGPSDEKSTVSTRLFLPPRKVKEKAKKLRSKLPEDMMSGTTSKNILAMTFKQVVLQNIWSFELALFTPGAERNMEDLEETRKVSVAFSISSSDERVFSVIAEAVCMCALDSTESSFRYSTLGTSSNNVFNWFKKDRRIASKDCSVSIDKLNQNEIFGDVKTLWENFNARRSESSRVMEGKHMPLASSTYTELEKIGGPEFSKWAREYLPAFRLQIDCDKLKNVKLECWNKSADNRWEVLLTHCQMVALMDIVDMYYDDVYTLPGKQLSCGVAADVTNLTKNKRGTSLWKMISFTLASGLFVISIGILTQLFWPSLTKGRLSSRASSPASSSETICCKHQSSEATKVEDMCILIVKKIKDAAGRPGNIATDKAIGAWTGELPSYLRVCDTDVVQKVISDGEEDTGTTSLGELPLDLSSSSVSLSDKSNAEMETKSAQDIASYQVVLSTDGEIIGFQPTSRAGVNYWASNPLARELYKGKKLTPGFLEPGLKIPRPSEIVVLELLMSVNPDSWFALARPIR